MKLTDFSAEVRLEAVDLKAISSASSSRIREFSRQIAAEDLVYYYCSVASEWDAGMGSEGYIVVRDGEIVASLVWRMN